MRKNITIWIIVLLASMVLLVLYLYWMFAGFNNSNSNMMWNWFGSSVDQVDEGNKLSINQIENEINNYLKAYDTDMDIDDIFIYEDSDYYVSIVEKETGIGAMELLVNPYTGQIYPEYGPNMMWNVKYGMRGRNNWNNGMMGRDNDDIDYIQYKNHTIEEATAIADEYVKDDLNADYSVTGDGHEFYGYYTLHIYENDETVGMLSVNYYTGEVWYHSWHGELIEEISSDEH